MSQQLTVFQKPGDLLSYLKTGQSSIEMALPKHLNPDRMLRLAVTAFSTTRGLRECTGQSILASLIVASQLGLEPGVAGQGYLIPYKDRRNGVSICTFVAGWQGMVGLLNNTGKATAWTGCVYKGDTFDFQLGSAPRLNHIPGPNYGDPELIEWVYACGKVNGSEQPIIEAWPIARVWKHRDRFNKVGRDHYSYQHPEMYARKVVLLQVLKYLPRSVELNNALVAADATERGGYATVQDGIVIEVQNEQDDPKQGQIGAGNPVDDQQPAPKQEEPQQSKREYQLNKTQQQPKTTKPKPDPEPEPEQEQQPEHAYTPRKNPQPVEEQEPSAEDIQQAQPKAEPKKQPTSGPSLAELQNEVTKKLNAMNIGKVAFCRVLHSEGLTPEVTPFGNVPADVLQSVVDTWDDFKEKLLPQ